MPKLNIGTNMSGYGMMLKGEIVVNKVLTDTNFGQAFSQLKSLDPSEFRRHFISRRPFLLDCQERTFRVTIEGVAASDFTANYREFFTRISMELRTGVIPLFTHSKNGINEVGIYQDAVVPNPSFMAAFNNLPLYRFLGNLIGVSIRTKVSFQDLCLPSIIWRSIAGEKLNLQDIEHIDIFSYIIIEKLYNLDSSLADDPEFLISVHKIFANSSFEGRKLIGNEAQFQSLLKELVNKKFKNSKEVANGLLKLRIEEFELQIKALVQGVYEVVPEDALKLFNWQEIKYLVCSYSNPSPTIREITRFDSSFTLESVSYFWRVFDNSSNIEKEILSNFLFGRSTLHPGECFKLFLSYRNIIIINSYT